MSTTTKFKIGDRVAVYNDGGRFVGQVTFVGDMSKELDIHADSGASLTVHFKQCRRLKLKPAKREPRTLYISEHNLSKLPSPNNDTVPGSADIVVWSSPPMISTSRFVEVIDEQD